MSCVYAGSNTTIKPVALDNRHYGNKQILFVGVDWQRKGGPELIEAFKRVLQKHPDARLAIVGCSPELSTPNCDIVGRVPVDQVVPRSARRVSMPWISSLVERFHSSSTHRKAQGREPTDLLSGMPASCIMFPC